MSSSCPGFKPQGHRPTKCRKCFKDIADHKIDLGPVSTYSVYRIRRGTSRSTLELDNLGSAANLSTLRYDSTTSLNVEPSTENTTTTSSVPRSSSRYRITSADSEDGPAAGASSNHVGGEEDDLAKSVMKEKIRELEDKNAALEEMRSNKSSEIIYLEGRIKQLENTNEELKKKSLLRTSSLRVSVITDESSGQGSSRSSSPHASSATRELHRKLADKEQVINELRQSLQWTAEQANELKEERESLMQENESLQQEKEKMLQEQAKKKASIVGNKTAAAEAKAAREAKIKTLEEKCKKTEETLEDYKKKLTIASESKSEELVLIKKQLTEKEEKMKEISKRLDESQKEISKIMKSNEERVKEIEKTNSKTLSEVKVKDTKIKQLEEKLKDLEKTATKKTTETGSLETKVKKLEESNEELKKKEKKMQETIDSLKESTESSAKKMHDKEQSVQEMSKQIESLKKDCKNFKDKCDEKTKELREFKESGTLDSKNKDTRLKMLEENNKELEKQVNKKISDITLMQSKMKRLEDQNRELSDKRRESEGTTKQTAGTADIYKKLISEKEDALKQKVQEIDELKNEMKSLRKDIDERDNEIREAHSKSANDLWNRDTTIKKLEKNVKELEDQLIQKNADSSSTVAKLIKLEEQMNDMKSKHKKSIEGSRSVKDANDLLKSQLNKKEDKLQELEKKYEDAKKELQATSKELDEVKKELKEIKSKTSTAIKSSESRIKELEEKNRALTKTCSSKTNELASADERMKSLEESVEEFRKKQKANLDASRTSADERESLKSQLREKDAQIAVVRTDLETVRSEARKLTRDLKQKESEVKDLSSKLEDDSKSHGLKLKRIEDEKKDLERQMRGKVSEISTLEAKVKKLEESNEELKKKSNSAAVNNKVPPDANVETLTKRIKEKDSRIRELLHENEDIKREVKSLAQELEELHDTFREDQAGEYRELKRDLEIAAKNVRVLTFKLKKTEKYCEQLEQEKFDISKKMKDMTETGMLSGDKHKMKQLETELSIAKEVSLKLHTEIEGLNNDRMRLESELKEVKAALITLQSSSPSSRFRSNVSSRPPTLKSLKESRLSPTPSVTSQLSFEKEKEYEEVVKSLYDTMEREKDLQEQLKFSEEEGRTMRRKLASQEQEMEILMKQIKKLALSRKSFDEDSDEVTGEEMRLKLVLYEEEMSVLRNRTDHMEKENESLQTELKIMQDKMIHVPVSHKKSEIPDLPPNSPPNVIYDYKIRLQEIETRELRKKLVDREKENENLRTELSMHRKKMVKPNLIRSSSSESNHHDHHADEALKQRIADLEAENEKLSKENKKIQLKMSMLSHSHERLNLIKSRSQEKLNRSRESLNRSRESLNISASTERLNRTSSVERISGSRSSNK